MAKETATKKTTKKSSKKQAVDMEAWYKDIRRLCNTVADEYQELFMELYGFKNCSRSINRGLGCFNARQMYKDFAKRSVFSVEHKHPELGDIEAKITDFYITKDEGMAQATYAIEWNITGKDELLDSGRFIRTASVVNMFDLIETIAKDLCYAYATINNN